MRQPRQKFAAAEQASRYAVATPRFATDCPETLEQNGVETQAIFVTGGERFAPIPDSTKARRAVTDRIIVMHRGRRGQWIETRIAWDSTCVWSARALSR